MIRFDHARKTYGSDVAVEDFSLTIEQGAVTVLVGSSGCGKTTLLRMVNRMVEPTSGDVFVEGTNVADHDPVELRRSIGYVMQNGGLLPHRTIVDNVATVPMLTGDSRKKARSKAGDLLELVGLKADEIGHRYPSQLSGGQQQRVGVARALAAESGVLLMDEPFAAVDPIVRRDLQDEVRRLQRDLGRTIIFVTHDIDEAFGLGDRVVLLSDGGHIAQEGTPAEFVENPADDFVATFIGVDRRRLSVSGDRVVDRGGRVVGMLDDTGRGGDTKRAQVGAPS